MKVTWTRKRVWETVLSSFWWSQKRPTGKPGNMTKLTLDVDCETVRGKQVPLVQTSRSQTLRTPPPP